MPPGSSRECSVQPAFHPQGSQRVLALSPAVFSLLRTSLDGVQHVLAVTNVTDQTVALKIASADLVAGSSSWSDLIGGARYESDAGQLVLELKPYAVVWLVPDA